MRLEDLLKGLAAPEAMSGGGRMDIAGLAYDSRQVRPGFLFVALPGRRRKGEDFIADAIGRGAAAVVAEQPFAGKSAACQIQVADARQALADLACAFHGHPSARLRMAGVTGTNGKTTITFLLKAILQAAGWTPGLLGTVQYEIGLRRIPAARTTPESVDLQAMLSQMIDAGCQAAVMEVSSHALAQHRVRGIDYDVAIFTNLTGDHLDYHGTEDQYFAAKARLFSGLGGGKKPAAAVVNIDDPRGRELIATRCRNCRTLTYGLGAEADVRAEEVVPTLNGSRFDAVTPWGRSNVQIHLPGRFNVYNALAALGAGGALGVPLNLMQVALATVQQVPGRMERLHARAGFDVFVDYAHTDDALRNVLQTLRELAKKRIIVLFGCGGDRDRTKRPRMGRVASELADYVILTSDNPRSEKPEAIAAEIAAGLAPGCAHEIILDREKAIARAMLLAGKDDVVLVAGKGHETSQEFQNTIVPFDDRDMVRKYQP